MKNTTDIWSLSGVLNLRKITYNRTERQERSIETAAIIEIYGYIGSALVVISMLMTSVIRLRVINMIGSVISGTYALIIGSFPLALMNGCLIAINGFNLYKLRRQNQEQN